MPWFVAVAMAAILLSTVCADSTWPRTIVDGRGDSVTLPREPQRIVSLAPSASEVIDALGIADRLVAIPNVGSTQADPRFHSATRISVYPAPSAEAVLALRPDLIVGADITSTTIAQRLRELGVPLLVLNNDGYDGILADIARAGSATGQETIAAEVTARLRDIRTAVLSEVQERAAPGPKVLLFIGESPEYVAGSGSYSGNLLGIAGAENLAAPLKQPWPQLTREAILAMNPQALIFATEPDSPEDGRQANRSEKLSAALATDPVWCNLAAVQNGKVYAIAPDLLNVPGPGVGEALRQLNAIIGEVAGSDFQKE